MKLLLGGIVTLFAPGGFLLPLILLARMAMKRFRRAG
jgi:hypothetical protein